MSQEDQDKLLLKALRDKNDASLQLSLIAKELDLFLEDAHGFLLALQKCRWRGERVAEDVPAVPATVSKYVNCSDLFSLLVDQKRQVARYTTSSDIVSKA